MKTLLIALLVFCSLTVTAREQISLSKTQLFNLGVKLGKPRLINSVPLMDAPAKVSIPPANEYLVSTSQAGLVNHIAVAIGDEVTIGQPLATIKSPDLLALQRHHLKSVNDLRLARTEYRRDQKLYKEGVIADRRWIQTKTSYQVYQSHFNETRQLLEIAGIAEADIAALEKTHRMSGQLNIVSPIAGVVLQRMVSAGERIDALGALFRIANLQELWLDISIPQQRIDLVHIGDKVVIEGMDVSAKVFLMGKSVDEQNQTVLVRAVVESGKENIRLGQSINARISQTSANPVYKVSNSALAQFRDKTYLFVRNAKGFKVQPVKVLGREEQESIITGEIADNSEIAIRGAVALKANFLGLGDE